MRRFLHGKINAPHAELVEARTTLVQVSCRPNRDSENAITLREATASRDDPHTTTPPAALLRFAWSSGATGKLAATWKPIVPE